MKKIAFASALALAFTASQADAQWVINEFQTDSSGSPDSQYVELYNATADASVSGLTLLCIRLSTGAAVEQLDLAGSATGNYYLLASDAYDGLTGVPTRDVALVNGFRTSFAQFVLVNTADLPAGYISDPVNYVFTDTDFSNGADIIDTVHYGDSVDTPLWGSVAEQVLEESGFGAHGGNRATDGGSWFVWPDADFPSAPNLSTYATPGAANSSSINDWALY